MNNVADITFIYDLVNDNCYITLQKINFRFCQKKKTLDNDKIPKKD